MGRREKRVGRREGKERRMGMIKGGTEGKMKEIGEGKGGELERGERERNK